MDGGHIPTAEPCQAQGGSPRALSVEFPDNPGGDALRRAKAAGRLALTLGLTSRLGAGKEGAVTVMQNLYANVPSGLLSCSGDCTQRLDECPDISGTTGHRA